ncbi:hypothetical protein D3C77_280340 [compost metagenome]
MAFVLGIAEGNLLGIGLKKKIEGVEHRHLGDQVDFNTQVLGFLREHQACQVVTLGVLLPVDEMPVWLHFQRIRENPRTTVRCRTQADNLWPQLDSTVVSVLSDMMQGDMDRHGGPPASLDGNGAAQDLCHPARPATPCTQLASTHQTRTETKLPCKPCTDLRLFQDTAVQLSIVQARLAGDAGAAQ